MTAQVKSSPPLVRPPRSEGGSALIGAALHLSLRGRVRLLIWMVWGLLTVLALGVFFLTIPARYSQLVIIGAENSIALQELGLPQTFFALHTGVLDAVLLIAYTAVGILIFARKANEWIGLFSSLTLIMTVVVIVRPGDSLLFVDPPLRLPVLVLFTLGAIAILNFVYIFPDGRFSPRFMRWVAVALSVFAVAFFLGPALFSPDPPWPPPSTSPVIVLGVVAGAVNQIYRYRHIASPAQRQQSKWVVYGVTVATLGVLLFLSIPLIMPSVLLPGRDRVWYVMLGVPVFYLAVFQLPLALAVSILRYRLWDIDLILSRTLIYVPLTAILAGLFAAVEKLTNDLFIALTGQSSAFAPVITTLVVVATFTPLKDFLTSVVEKRIQESGDPLPKLTAFAERVNARVTPLSVPHVTRRMLRELVAAYNAKGGAAYLEQGGQVHLIETIGEWDGEAALCLPLESSEHGPRFGLVALDDRRNGAQYSERDCQALTRLAQLVAGALEQDEHATHE